MTDNYVVVVTPEIDTEQRGRNPELMGMHLDVYLFIKDNPGCTRRDVTTGLALRSGSATARIKELIDRGLLIERGTVVDPLTKKTVNTLYAPTDFQHKAPRDRVRVNVYLLVDEDGCYYAYAKVEGGYEFNKKKHTAVVLTKRITIIAPYPNEYMSHFVKDTLAIVHPRDTLANTELIIDA